MSIPFSAMIFSGSSRRPRSSEYVPPLSSTQLSIVMSPPARKSYGAPAVSRTSSSRVQPPWGASVCRPMVSLPCRTSMPRMVTAVQADDTGTAVRAWRPPAGSANR
ncbi:hypothetical protein [Nonomuraea angiospora]|uniref:hypothetical protein n=1 Tax=Nonomuraea angiospora TaxID=46172 RepID=UPI0029A83083|nr:hypothetical protein [Nonomuraea angiospora]MDX3106411.1 hypothetical protein [Nonomuraea angiospora]